ncbi:MAG: hypothetical protein ACJ8KF_12265 [Chthoniobacterales bacterium]
MLWLLGFIGHIGDGFDPSSPRIFRRHPDH